MLIRNNEYVTQDNSDTNVWVKHFHATENDTVTSSIVSSSSVTNLIGPESAFSHSTRASNTSFQSAHACGSEATVYEDTITFTPIYYAKCKQIFISFNKGMAIHDKRKNINAQHLNNGK